MYMCVMEYFSAIKKEVNPAIIKTWMDLEDILLSEFSQRQNTVQSHMWNLIKRTQSNSQKRGGVRERELDKSGQKVQISSYKINKY